MLSRDKRYKGRKAREIFTSRSDLASCISTNFEIFLLRLISSKRREYKKNAAGIMYLLPIGNRPRG